MDKRKILLIIIVALIVLSICVSIVLVSLKKQQKISFNENSINGIHNNIATYDEELVIVDGDEPATVDDMGEIKTIEKCIQQYYDTVNVQSSIYFDQDGNKMLSDEEVNEKILKLLDENYKNENNIDISNLDKYVEKLDKSYIVISLKMEKVFKAPYEKYLVYGLLIDTDYSESKEFYIYVNTNYENGIFSIKPADISNGEDFKNIKLDNSEINIVKNEDNTYEISEINDQDIATDYFRRNKMLSLSNPEIAYDYLDDDYKNQKFGNIENYKNYIKDNYDMIKDVGLSQYKVNNEGTYSEYVCIDQNENYFIVDQYSALEYKIFLDSYTIDNAEFIKKYDNADDQQKGGMNIEKIKMALNNKDYAYVYGKLDNTFKKNNFDTIEKFENYCKENFYNSCDFGYSSSDNKGNGIYTYDVEVSSLADDNNDIKNVTFIIQLKDDRDFAFSFSFN